MEEISQKPIGEMTNKEILRLQLEQLAEVSKDCLPEELYDITCGMIHIVSYLENNQRF